MDNLSSLYPIPGLFSMINFLNIMHSTKSKEYIYLKVREECLAYFGNISRRLRFLRIPD